MEKNFRLKLSEYAKTYNSAYVARVVKITNLKPIKGSKKLQYTTVCGYPVIVDENTKLNDIMIFVPSGCAINKDFLGKNNLYEPSSYKLNSNRFEVDKYILEYEKETDKKKKDKILKNIKNLSGFFQKNGKVKAINLLKHPSQGFLIDFKNSITKWIGDFQVDWMGYVGTSFDVISVDDKDFVFCEKFIPEHEKIRSENIKNNAKKPINLTDKLNKKAFEFDRMIEGQFSFHIKPKMLNTNIEYLKPDTVVQISSKWHGASWIVGNILYNKKLSIWDKLKKKLGFKIKEVIYDDVYSSSSSIKNPSINHNTNNFYKSNIWKSVNDVVYPFLDKGMIAYGEVVGYLPNSIKLIQKNYDYGCSLGQFKIIIYRIVKVDENSNKTEFTSSEIRDWCENKLKRKFENFNSLIEEVPFTPVYELYYGKLSDLYPDLEINEDWHENILNRLMSDERFYMNQKCHYCRNNVPTEGIVVRVENNNNKIECYKLKCHDFYLYEQSLLDKGEIDIETEETLN